MRLIGEAWVYVYEASRRGLGMRLIGEAWV